MTCAMEQRALAATSVEYITGEAQELDCRLSISDSVYDDCHGSQAEANDSVSAFVVLSLAKSLTISHYQDSAIVGHDLRT